MVQAAPKIALSHESERPPAHGEIALPPTHKVQPRTWEIKSFAAA